MIALHGYPLSIVEHEEMRRFVKNLNPIVNEISHNDMENIASLLYFRRKKQSSWIKFHFPPDVSHYQLISGHMMELNR
jgi:hypothetical protein